MRKSLPVCMWAAEDRPTNKLEDQGVRSLSNAELLSIIIGSGTDAYNQVEIARMLLAENGNSLAAIANMTVGQLKQSTGIGEATAKRILAAIDLGRRMFSDTSERCSLGTASMIYNHMHPIVGNLDVEEFWALLLDQHYGLIKRVCIGRGGLTEVTVDVRIIMKQALLANATIIAVCHNHPSGMVTPSRCDDDVTRTIKNACGLMKIHFADHVILGNHVYYSYREQGKI